MFVKCLGFLTIKFFLMSFIFLFWELKNFETLHWLKIFSAWTVAGIWNRNEELQKDKNMEINLGILLKKASQYVVLEASGIAKSDG